MGMLKKKHNVEYLSVIVYTVKRTMHIMYTLNTAQCDKEDEIYLAK